MHRLTTALILGAANLLLGNRPVFADHPAGETPRRPNVVFILADDLGWGDLGCYGHPYARTPNIDRLAAEGTRFEQFYSTGITCCPARTGLMTSKLPATYPVYPANGGFGNRTTITELLKKNGYRTGHFGKWHIGPDVKDGTYGIDVIGSDDETSKRRKQRTSGGRDAPIFDDAIRFIEENKAGPFYVNLWGHISHHPIAPPESYVAKFADLKIDETKFPPPMLEKFANCRRRGGDVNERLRQYLADVASLDDDVGRLLARLDELGLRENTIVVFSSDQGPAPLDDEPRKSKKGANDVEALRLNALGSAGPLRGGKHGMYEGGVRVPWIVRWPGKTPAGRVDANSVISGADWLPTLCSITGTSTGGGDLDGEDASAAWLGKPFTRTKPLFWKTSNPQSEIALRVDNWKIHYPNRKRGEVELYDLATDPNEQTNLATQRADVVKRLTAQIEKWNATLPSEYDKTDDKQD